jgi:thymidylate synthase
MECIPQLIVEGDLLPEAWEKSLLLLREKGRRSRKESYTKPSGVDEILEASMKIIVNQPLREPMIHMGCEGLMSLDDYVDEVLHGTKDDRIGHGWDYTYHERLFHYEKDGSVTDQIGSIVEKLRKASFTNRAQAVIWMPWRDPTISAPPCLQRVWCKIVCDEWLEMHTSWRSRDAYNAAFMNMYALIRLQEAIAERIGVKVGRYVDDSDSYHVYDRNFESLNNFVARVEAARRTGRTIWIPSDTLKNFHRNG